MRKVLWAVLVFVFLAFVSANLDRIFSETKTDNLIGRFIENIWPWLFDFLTSSAALYSVLVIIGILIGYSASIWPRPKPNKLQDLGVNGMDCAQAIAGVMNPLSGGFWPTADVGHILSITRSILVEFGKNGFELPRAERQWEPEPFLRFAKHYLESVGAMLAAGHTAEARQIAHQIARETDEAV